MKKKRLFIIGAGGSGIEIESFLSKIPENKKDYYIEGYLDDNPSALENIKSDYKILGKILEYPFRVNDYALISITDPAIKKKIFFELRKRVKIYTFYDPSIFVGKYSEIGEGSVICPQSLISTNVKIGKCVYINSGSQIGHNSTIEDFSSIMANVNIGGECIIGKEVFFGTGSILIPRIAVCDRAVIGAGSVVIRKIKEPATYFGNPASKI